VARVEVHSDRRFQFDAEPRQFWAAIGSVERYQEWWPWLRSFEATGLVTGDRWHCTVKPPLPYTVRFTVDLEDVVPDTRIVASVSGDLAGRARLEVAPDDDGCIVHLRSGLAPTNTLLRAIAVLGRPIARYGHDWVLDVGAGQFASRAL
jgi:uncharacterized protein YndB with AHSA1/START domain